MSVLDLLLVKVLQKPFYLASFSPYVLSVHVKTLKRKYAIASGQDVPIALTVGWIGSNNCSTMPDLMLTVGKMWLQNGVIFTVASTDTPRLPPFKSNDTPM